LDRLLNGLFIESNQIYPSLPALFKIAEVLSVEAGAFFQESPAPAGQAVFKAGDTIYLTSEIPTNWKNPGPGPARLLWFKIK
jgi:transcriptional regulator with XRE-family HTH domain